MTSCRHAPRGRPRVGRGAGWILALWALAPAAYAAETSTTAASSTTAPGRHLGGLGRLEQPFSVEADVLYALPKAGQYRAEGNVVVRRPGAELRADRVTFDEAAQVAVAEGHVTAVEGETVLTCDSVRMKVPELVGGVEQAVLHIRDLGGRDQLVVQADLLERPSPRVVAVEGATFTACACGEGKAPSWKIRAWRAEIDLDSGALLKVPIFYVLDVPVMVLPLFYVPLGPRRSGLLTPRFGYSPVTGFKLGQPLYLTLGRSWDVTLTPFYLSARGGGGDVELRYAPTADSAGQWTAQAVVDVGEFVDGGWHKTGDPIGRYALAGQHRTRLPGGGLVAEVNLLGDPAYLGDFADTFIRRQAEWTRSRLTYHQASQPHLRWAAGLQLMQDLRPATYAAPEGPSPPLREVQLLSGALPGPANVRYRFFDGVLAAAPAPVIAGWPLLGQARLALSTFSAPRPEAPRFARVDLRPAVALPITLPLGLVLEPEVSGRFTAWAGRADSTSASATRLAVRLATQLHLDLWRDFGEVAHQLRPALEHVLIPKVATSGDPVFGTADEVDLLREVHQVRARLDTGLYDPKTGARWAHLGGWLGRDLGWGDAAGAGTSELVLTGDAQLGRPGWPVVVAVAGRAALRLDTGALTEARAGLSIASRRGDRLAVTYGRWSTTRPEYAQLAPEELVPSGTIDPAQYLPFADYAALGGPARQPFLPWSGFDGLIVSAQAKPFAPLTLAFDLSLGFDDPAVLRQVYGEAGQVSVVRSTRTTVGWDSPCRCWGGYVAVSTARDRDGFQFDVGLDLARLGSVGLGSVGLSSTP
jgi:hypothetical protein